MENFYLVIVVILILLAVSDLVVGVSNDAVNFLNSAIGSKAAPFKIIMLVAALGVLVGATFSSGMMEVARKGIFHPDQFYFSEIMIIFLAVMITDIVMLDLFNTFGLPTSTTVSIVFELLGAAVAMTIIKISHNADGLQDMNNYINTGKALAIISGILVSVVVAFTVGLVVQFFTRMVFSFNFEKTYKYFGALWGGFSISAIIYFILIKGAKGSSFLTDQSVEWIQSHTWTILLVSFAALTILLQLLVMLFRFNILKFIVLIGTFGLAMAFAGNDLVNFIGVPLAGLESFKGFAASGMTDPSGYSMTILTNPVKTPTFYLLIAGMVMVITLWLSRKARSVTATTVDLARQSEGEERFQSSFFARSIVRSSIDLKKMVTDFIPGSVMRVVGNRFDVTKAKKVKKKDAPSFDLVRASVNLVVASILIAFGTSLKLPLSTTYVTFMVAMGTSLADGAWGRESAVYRITGVLTVIAGWFVTALVAFTIAFVMAYIIHWGGIYAIVALLAVAVVLLIRTHAFQKKKDDEKQKKEELEEDDFLLGGDDVFKQCNETVITTLLAASKMYSLIIYGLINEKRKQLKKVNKEVKALNKQTKNLKNNIHKIIRKLEEDSVETGHYYVQVLDYLRETAHCLTFIAKPVFEHVDNNHSPMLSSQVDALKQMEKKTAVYFKTAVEVLTNLQFDDLDKVIDIQQNLLEMINTFKKKQVKMIKKEEAGTRNSLLYFEILTESKNLLLYVTNVLKAERDFVIYNESNGH
jgi:phosphate/sulfate permease